MTQPIWGQHLILDLGACPRELLVNADHLRKWTLELVDGIGMKAFGAPQVEHFATQSHDAAGYTVVQLIETSNICAHFAENLGQVYIDIFSCKAFDNALAESICVKYFEPKIITRRVIERGSFNAHNGQAD
ncbi:MAG TPA: S-adenosylmethionine decarboxylase [Porticoccaceae bacterium]|nr:S-adenosylmethionine decarboxylase [Porticoccaceae bacterium]